jgi:hypothetical protein
MTLEALTKRGMLRQLRAGRVVDRCMANTSEQVMLCHCWTSTNVSVYCENHTKHTDALCRQNAENWCVKARCIYSNHWNLRGYYWRAVLSSIQYISLRLVRYFLQVSMYAEVRLFLTAE